MATTPNTLALLATDARLCASVQGLLRSMAVTVVHAGRLEQLRAEVEQPPLLLMEEPERRADLQPLLEQGFATFQAPILLISRPGTGPAPEFTNLVQHGVIDVIPGADPKLLGDVGRFARHLLRAIKALTEPMRPHGHALAPAVPRTPWSRSSTTPGTMVAGARREPPVRPLGPVQKGLEAPQIIAIGISTGGPAALAEMWPRLDPTLMPPVCVVQHMPVDFVPPFAERLNKLGKVITSVPTDGETARPGHAYIAPGNRHLTVQRQGSLLKLRLLDEEPVSGHRPSADRLYRSLADQQIRTLGIQMTGMGRDGAKELKRLHDQGCFTIGQDEASSVVYGMPRVAFELGAISKQLPLHEIPGYLMQMLKSLVARR